MKAIVIYYSWGGNTKSIAEKVAHEFELRHRAHRHSRAKRMATPLNSIARSGRGRRKRYEHRGREIKPPSHSRSSDYDTVILGTPVWGAANSAS